MLHAFLWGALTMSSALAALFFLRFWRMTGDRFFVFFALAFVAIGLNWAMSAILNVADEQHVYLYVVRLIGFLLIIVGILDKNRRS